MNAFAAAGQDAAAAFEQAGQTFDDKGNTGGSEYAFLTDASTAAQLPANATEATTYANLAAAQTAMDDQEQA